MLNAECRGQLLFYRAEPLAVLTPHSALRCQHSEMLLRPNPRSRRCDLRQVGQDAACRDHFWAPASGALCRRDITADVSFPYEEMPHFPSSTMESHAGRLVCGTLGGSKTVVAMEGQLTLREATSSSR